jgi:hypothetical protein
MPSNHALLSASSAERWLACTAAPRFEAQFPAATSEYAEAGTLAHKICELKVLKKFTPMGPKTYSARLAELKQEPLYDAEMDSASDLYIEHLTEKAMSRDSPPLVSAEVRVDLTAYVPEGFGTCDCVMIGGGTLDITDFKYGKGVLAAAAGNAQMRLYALGALAKYEPFYGGLIQRVRMTIVQPRVQNEPSSETLTVDELKAWGESIKPLAQKAYSGFGEFAPGEHCRFCRGRAQCRARSDAHTALEDFKDYVLPTPENPAKANAPAPPEQANGEAPAPSMLTNGEIGGLLTRGKTLAAWYSDLEEYALSALLKGEDIPGWKAVAGRSNRAFSDTDAAAAAIIASGCDEALVYERKPKPLTELEKLMGKKDFVEKIGMYIVKPLGKPTLAPLSDKREPYSSAAADFAGAAPQNPAETPQGVIPP